MQYVRFIYNPYSGDRSILNKIDYIIELYQDNGFIIVPYRIEKGKGVDAAFEGLDPSQFNHILIAGGDGTIDSVINSMKKKNINLPVGILPVGTANDFAKFLKIPNNIEESCEKILKSSAKTIDIAKINESYFVNVASTGLFADVSKKTNVNLKNMIGKLAYYFKGLEELPNFKKINISIKSKDVQFKGDIYLILVFNGQSAGNFNLAPKSDIGDGLLDVIVFKAIPIRELVNVFIKVLRNEHLNSDGVLYFKTKSLDIHCKEKLITDIDGEEGPSCPLTISCIENGLSVLGIE